MTLSKAIAGVAAVTLLGGVPAAEAQHRGGGGGGGSRGGGVAVGRVAPRGIAPRVVTGAPVRFYRPYYTFRPRVSIGFGLWGGYPISYPYYYGYYNPYYAPYAYVPEYPPYGYAYPAPAYPAYPPQAYPSAGYPSPGYPASTYPPSSYPPAGYPSSPGSIGVQGPNQQASTGGLSFEITPSDAQVFVDGRYVGTAGQFTPTSQPLGLTPGRHHVEIRAQGYRTMDLDVDIVPGQVIPYQGALER